MNLTTARYLGVGHLLPDPRWEMAHHSHAFHELIVVQRGQIYVEIRDQIRTARASELLWYPAGVVHCEWVNSRAPAETIFMSWTWQELPAHWPLQLSDTLGRIGEMSRWLLADRDVHCPGQPLLHAILTEFNRLVTHPDDPLVTGLRTHIRQHLADSITLDHLAAKAGLSKFHLIRRYKALTGRTPLEDVRHIRLQTARDLLLTTALSLKEIAPRVGLGDEYRLCRLFRQYFQTTPGALRQRSSSDKMRG
ncbi:MAG: HTH-type transcriptional activator RhaS [Verrucomicrobiae bacterium]|nr:HTH-type transcriptional activator RhaS [Verrucomicrobiae bacterium]